MLVHSEFVDINWVIDEIIWILEIYKKANKSVYYFYSL